MSEFKVNNPDYAKFSFGTDMLLDSLRVESNSMLALSLLMGWDDTAKKWRPSEVDATGRIRVTLGEQSASEVNNSTASITSTSSVVLVSNSDREQYIIRNTGTETVYLSLSENDATTSDFPLESGEILIDDRWSGEINAITASGTSSLSIMEYSA